MSFEARGIRLEIRRGRPTGEVGFEATLGDLGGMSTTEGLTCWTILKDDSVGVNTGGACLQGERESSTRESGRTILTAAGGAFLVPLRIESRDLFGVGVVVTMVEIGGASGIRTLLEDDRFGVLKLGGGGEWLRGGRLGTPNAECRKFFG